MEYLEELTGRYPVLETVKENVRAACELLKDCYEQGGEVLVAGNGRSCADSEHIVGELMKGFVRRRSVSSGFAHALRQTNSQRDVALAEGLQGAFPAVALTGHMALSIAFLSDVDGEMIYAQQLHGYGKKEDVFIDISTLGNVGDVMYAAAVAKTTGIKITDLAGKDGGALVKADDIPVVAPEKEAFKIQEFHLPVCHAPCLMLEERFYEV